MSLEIPSESSHLSQRNAHPTSDHTVLEDRARVLLGSGTESGRSAAWLLTNTGSPGERHSGLPSDSSEGSGSRPSVDF